MVQRRGRPLPRAAEAAPRYGKDSTRYNLVVPTALKRAVDAEAQLRGTSGPDLARQFLEDGLRKLRDEALWKRVAEMGPKLAARDRAIVERWDRWELAWDRSDAAARRHR